MERWLPVVGYEGRYQVSDQGRLRSLQRSGRVMRPSQTRGRPHVNLRGHGRIVTRVVSSLVLTAFRGRRPPGMLACHTDGDAANNKLDNLRWDTVAANYADDRRNGIQRGAVGAKHWRTQLNEDDVRCILAEPYFPSVTVMLGRCFNISSQQARDIRLRKYWKRVELVV